MRDLANAVPPEELSQDACRLYGKLPPAIPEGATGWGTKGTCDTDRVGSLALER
jgi:hypothetical protein